MLALADHQTYKTPIHLHHNVGPLVALACGEAGLPSRILAAKYGAFLTYGTLEDGIPGAVGSA